MHRICLTLLPGPTHAETDADQAEQRFTCSLLPHSDDWRAGSLPAAHALNVPTLMRRADGGKGKWTDVLCEPPPKHTKP